MRVPLLWACTAAIAASLTLSASAQVFEKPVRLQANDEFVDVEIGHAAPYLYDFDEDGVKDLLVGQFGDGKLRIYRNAGSDAKPQYEAHKWFMADGKIGTIPAS